jgi:hypothetical protein
MTSNRMGIFFADKLHDVMSSRSLRSAIRDLVLGYTKCCYLGPISFLTFTYLDIK